MTCSWEPPKVGTGKAVFTDQLWEDFLQTDLAKGLDAWVEHSFTETMQKPPTDISLGSMPLEEARELVKMAHHAYTGCKDCQRGVGQWLTTIAMRVVAEVERIEETEEHDD